MRPPGAIELDRLTKRDGERRGIEEVSLQVEAGDVTLVSSGSDGALWGLLRAGPSTPL